MTAAKYPATAHIPGLGPANLCCRDCVSYNRPDRTKQTGECVLATKFRGLKKGLQDVPAHSPACKYFEAKSTS